MSDNLSILFIFIDTVNNSDNSESEVGNCSHVGGANKVILDRFCVYISISVTSYFKKRKTKFCLRFQILITYTLKRFCFYGQEWKVWFKKSPLSKQYVMHLPLAYEYQKYVENRIYFYTTTYFKLTVTTDFALLYMTQRVR
jgi:hypothetical protein